MTNSEKIGLATLVIGILAIISSIIIGKASIDSAFDIAERSGVLDKPIIKPFVGKLLLSPDKTTDITFGINPTIEKEGVIISSLPVGIQNAGENRIKNITVTYKYHQIFQRNVLENLDFLGEGVYPATKIEKHFSRFGDSDYVSYRIPELDAGIAILINDPIFLSVTHLKEIIDFEEMKIPIEMKYTIEFLVSISADGIKNTNYPMKFEVITANSLNDLKHYLGNIRGPKEAVSLRGNTTFFEYLGLLFRNTERSLILVYPEMKEIKHGEYIIYSNQGQNYQISAATYDIVQWKYLINRTK